MAASDTPPPNHADRARRIEDALREGLDPTHLVIEDESARHAGHAGAASGGGHFRVLIVSAAFRGRSQVERQRAVYALLGSAVGTTIHALALRTLTPEEWEAGGGGRRSGAGKQ
jgi:BolA protein